MLLDADIVAVSPSSVYRVLKEKGLLQRWNRKPLSKGTGFQEPAQAHEHWHIDVSYINIRCTFYYLISILDGYSRFIVHWELRESMTEGDVEIVLQRAGARRLVGEFVDYYNTERLHSAIGYITPKDKLEGREQEIFADRDRKLAGARNRRKERRKEARISATRSTCQGCEAPEGLGIDSHVKYLVYPGIENPPYQ